MVDCHYVDVLAFPGDFSANAKVKRRFRAIFQPMQK